MADSSHPPTEPSPPPSGMMVPPPPSSKRGRANPRISFVITGQGYPTLEQVKGAYMAFVLQGHNGHRAHTAKALGIARETIYRKFGKGK